MSARHGSRSNVGPSAANQTPAAELYVIGRYVPGWAWLICSSKVAFNAGRAVLVSAGHSIAGDTPYDNRLGIGRRARRRLRY
jgi:hypothetical protein